MSKCSLGSRAEIVATYALGNVQREDSTVRFC